MDLKPLVISLADKVFAFMVLTELNANNWLEIKGKVCMKYQFP